MTNKEYNRVIREGEAFFGKAPQKPIQIGNLKLHFVHLNPQGVIQNTFENIASIIAQNQENEYKILNETAKEHRSNPNNKIPTENYMDIVANGDCMKGINLPNGQEFKEVNGEKYIYCRILKLENFIIENVILSEYCPTIVARLKNSQNKFAELAITDDDIGIFQHQEYGKIYLKARRIAKIEVDDKNQIFITGQYCDSATNQYPLGTPHTIDNLIGIVQYIYPINFI